MAATRKPRSAWLAAASGGQSARRASPDPDEAQQLVDAVLTSLGIDTTAVTDRNGWRHIGAGSAFGMVNIVEWEPGQHFIAVCAPVMRAPTDLAMRERLFGVLLTMNSYETGGARFSLLGDWIMMTAARPITGLDAEEVLDLIQMVLQTADRLDDPLQETFAITMPAVQIEPNAHAAILALMWLCGARARQVFRLLIEGWVARGGTIQASERRILLTTAGDPPRVIAELVALVSGESVVRIPWEASEAQWSSGGQDAEAYRMAVPQPSGFQVIAGLAQLLIHSGFTDAMAEQLLTALAMLDRASGSPESDL